jgi:DNA-binding LytR/AlgR family response regulator
MQLKCLIIDDEPLAHEIITDYASGIPFLEISKHCYLATEALLILQETPIDLIFLDINMPKIKGLDFLRTLKAPPIVIITTAYKEYALEGYELDVCDYLLKPFRFDRFVKAVNKAYALYQQKTITSKSEAPVAAEATAAHLLIKSDKRYIQLAHEDIYYLESYGNFVKVWKHDEYHLTARTLSSFEEELPPRYFFRIHKSYIINRMKLDYWEGNQVRLKNGQTLPIGKNQRQAFKAFIMSNNL